jgi:hypothetical protein
MTARLALPRPGPVHRVRDRGTLLLSAPALFVFALTVRVVFLLLTHDTYDFDEFVVLLLGRDMAHGAVPYSGFMFFHPPGMLAILAVLNPVVSGWWPLARGLMALTDAGTALLVWRIGCLIWDGRTAAAAFLLYVFNPLSLIAAVRVGPDPVITFLGVAGLYLLLADRGYRGSIIAGVLLGLAVWVKYPALYFLPIYVLAAPRRVLPVLGGMAAALALTFAPYWSQGGALLHQTITFQRNRWLMAPDLRIYTTLVYWLGVNLLAVVSVLCGRPRPPWLAVGFLLGGAFVLTSQVYYHYFVPVVPFAALLAAPLARRRLRNLKVVGVAAAVVLLGWAALIDLGGPGPAFVTAAHLSDLAPSLQIVETRTAPGTPLLADRYEYAYLSRRPALAHYFWNVGVIVNARYLEDRVPRAGAVVVSVGPSSGYPPGLRGYLDRHYRRIDTPAASVWLVRRPPGTRRPADVVGARGFEPPTSASRTLRATKLRYAPTVPAARPERPQSLAVALSDSQ